LFAPVQLVDWGAPVSVGGSVTGPVGSNLGSLGQSGSWPVSVGTVLDAASNQNYFQISSNDQLTRADNTEMAWNGTNWAPAPFVDGTNIYFGGNFGAPSTPSATLPYGDNLLGALAPSGASNGNPQITFTFSETLSYIQFQVSSAVSSDFVAQLLVFDSLNNQLGTFQVTDTGDGGSCPGLAMRPPQPCNSAPLIWFNDPNDSIAKVELILFNDPSGVYIDQLGLASIPEPGSWTLTAAGLIAAAYVWKRRQARSKISVVGTQV
jgi:hypothetical protein